MHFRKKGLERISNLGWQKWKPWVLHRCGGSISFPSPDTQVFISFYFDLCILSTGYRSCDCSMALCPCCGCMKQISHRSFPPSDHIVQITNLGSAFQELRSSSFILAFDKCKWYSDTPVLSARSSNVLLVQLSAKNAKDPSKRVQNEFLHEVVDTWWNWSLASGNPHFNHFIPKFRHTDRQGISNTGQWNASEINAFLMHLNAFYCLQNIPRKVLKYYHYPCQLYVSHLWHWQSMTKPSKTSFKHVQTGWNNRVHQIRAYELTLNWH